MSSQPAQRMSLRKTMGGAAEVVAQETTADAIATGLAAAVTVLEIVADWAAPVSSSKRS